MKTIPITSPITSGRPQGAAHDLPACVMAVAAMVAMATMLGLLIAPRWGTAPVVLLYIVPVLAAAVWFGFWPALLAAIVSPLVFNYWFTAPYRTLLIHSPADVVSVVVLFAVAVVTSRLAASVREQARLAEAHAARNATIAGLARALLGCTSEQEIAGVTVRELRALFDCNASLLAGTRKPRVLAGMAAEHLTPSDLAVAALVLESGERAGRGVDRAIPTEWQFHAVRSGAVVLAAVGLARDDGVPAVRGDQLPLLDNLLDQVALAMERTRLESEAREFARVRERDQVRATLLASIGQDLAPPLEAIGGAVNALRRGGAGDRAVLAQLASETGKLERYLANLTDLEPEGDRRPLEIGEVRIDLFRRAVFLRGEEVHLAPREYGVLAELAKHPGRVLPHAHLLRAVWGPAHENQIDYLRVAVRGLRQKLERDPAHPELIVNEPAVGYRLRLG